MSTSDVTVEVVNSRTDSLTRKINRISRRFMTTFETSSEDCLQLRGESTNKFGGREG